MSIVFNPLIPGTCIYGTSTILQASSSFKPQRTQTLVSRHVQTKYSVKGELLVMLSQVKYFPFLWKALTIS